MQFVDRYLKCSDCGNEFIFTAGEQMFFNDKQFKNDPKRCKLCKAKRAGLGRSADPKAAAALPFSRTETRTECSECGIETTVPFKPTQGRPVLCRGCFQQKRVPPGVAAVTVMDSAEAQVMAQEKSMGLMDSAPAGELQPAAMGMIANSSMPLLHEGEPVAEAASL
jgi:CxxC-x17-CxxC domain-containing protein